MTVRKTCILILLFQVGIVPVSAADSRPNFLFIFADDWGRFASAYAQLDGPGTPNDAVRTPHFADSPAKGSSSGTPSSPLPPALPAAALSSPDNTSGVPDEAPSCGGPSGTIPSPSSPCCSSNPAITSASLTKSGLPASPAMPLTANNATPTRITEAASVNSPNTSPNSTPPGNRSTILSAGRSAYPPMAASLSRAAGSGRI